MYFCKTCNDFVTSTRWVRPVRDLQTGITYRGAEAEKIKVIENAFDSEFWRYHRFVMPNRVCNSCGDVVHLTREDLPTAP
jgi:hypothetical protein